MVTREPVTSLRRRWTMHTPNERGGGVVVGGGRGTVIRRKVKSENRESTRRFPVAKAE